jgi:4-hydroxy-2-oxoglutarate aldolase
MPIPASVGGIIAPVVTPFDPTGDALDIESFRFNLRAHLEAGLAGIVVAGSTGEATLLSESERADLLECARAVVPRERWLIAGIGAESTRLTIERARTAGDIGVDAVLVVGPHYYPQSGTPDALIGHYTRIADKSPVPVMLYNIPQYMHYNLPPSVVEQLAQHPNIVGMKDSGGDLTVLAGFLRAQSPTFSVLTGNASILQSALTAGVRGGILAVAVFAPALALALVEAVRSGRASEAAAIQAQLVPLGREIISTFGPAGVKAAVDAAGLRGGPTRSPLQPLDADSRARVARLVQAATAEAAGVGAAG